MKVKRSKLIKGLKLLSLTVIIMGIGISCSDDDSPDPVYEPTMQITYDGSSLPATIEAVEEDVLTFSFNVESGNSLSNVTLNGTEIKSLSGDSSTFTYDYTVEEGDNTLNFLLTDAQSKTVSVSVSVTGLKKINVGPVSIVNHSFEEPAEGDDDNVVKTFCFTENVPGWNSDGACTDSGVSNAANGTTDGRQRAFLYTKDHSPEGDFNTLYQMTDYEIVGRETITMTYDIRDLWQTWDFKASLYYEDGGERIVLAETVYDDSSSNAQLTDEVVVLVSDNIPAEAIGKTIGVEFHSLVSTDWAGWLAIDNVRLDVSE